MKKRVVILTSQNGDWEGLYIDEELIEEGHTLGEGRYRTFLLEMAERFEFGTKDINICEVCDKDEEYLQKHGNFPSELSELEGTYDNE